MANRGNMKMIQGTSALKIVPAREEARIIDFPIRQRHASLGAHGRKQTAGERLRTRLGDEAYRELMGAECQLTHKQSILGGSLIMLGGVVLVLARVFLGM